MIWVFKSQKQGALKYCTESETVKAVLLSKKFMMDKFTIPLSKELVV
jgi:hypothetical protein